MTEQESLEFAKEIAKEIDDWLMREVDDLYGWVESALEWAGVAKECEAEETESAWRYVMYALKDIYSSSFVAFSPMTNKSFSNKGKACIELFKSTRYRFVQSTIDKINRFFEENSDG